MIQDRNKKINYVVKNNIYVCHVYDFCKYSKAFENLKSYSISGSKFTVNAIRFYCKVPKRMCYHI